MAETPAPKPSIFQEIMGNRITQLVLWGTIVIAAVGIVFAFVALDKDETHVKTAFGILQYIFGALLPLWGTWIGTILAYYYSKENFESANKSVQQIVDKISSEKKLESVKAIDVMIGKDKLIAQILPDGQDLSIFKLKEDCIDYLELHQIKRLIILDSLGCARYVIHRDTIAYFITTNMIAGQAVSGFTLKDMYEKGSDEIKDIMDNSVRFIAENANLLEAKKIMQQNKDCQDVFLTKTGNSKEPIIGWITNVTIAENSVV